MRRRANSAFFCRVLFCAVFIVLQDNLKSPLPDLHCRWHYHKLSYQQMPLHDRRTGLSLQLPGISVVGSMINSLIGGVSATLPEG